APFTFERFRLGSKARVPFASVGDFCTWSLEPDGKFTRVVETNNEPRETLDLEVFLAQAGLVAALHAATGDLSLPEESAVDVMRAMLAIHPHATPLPRFVPFWRARHFPVGTSPSAAASSREITLSASASTARTTRSTSTEEGACDGCARCTAAARSSAVMRPS